MAGERIACYPKDVSLAVRDRLVAVGQFRSAACFLVTEPERVAPYATGDRYCTVSLPTLDRQPDSYTFDDDATAMDWMNAVVVVTLWVRLGLDENARATDLLTAETLGVDQRLRGIAQTLNDFDPTDSNGDYILKESLSFLGATFRGQSTRA